MRCVSRAASVAAALRLGPGLVPRPGRALRATWLPPAERVCGALVCVLYWGAARGALRVRGDVVVAGGKATPGRLNAGDQNSQKLVKKAYDIRVLGHDGVVFGSVMGLRLL